MDNCKTKASLYGHTLVCYLPVGWARNGWVEIGAKYYATSTPSRIEYRREPSDGSRAYTMRYYKSGGSAKYPLLTIPGNKSNSLGVSHGSAVTASVDDDGVVTISPVLL